MKPEDVYRIAEEVGLYDYRVPKLVLMDFAIQVASAVRSEEREACAKFVEEGYVRQFDEPWRKNLAAAIRERRQ